MEQINNQDKLKIIALALIMNVISFLLGSSSCDKTIEGDITIDYKRKDYVDIKINAQLLTSFELNKEVALYSKDNNVLTHSAFLIRHFNDQIDDFSQLTTKKESYIISVHKQFANTIMREPVVKIIPYNTKLSPYNLKKVITHEINI